MRLAAWPALADFFDIRRPHFGAVSDPTPFHSKLPHRLQLIRRIGKTDAADRRDLTAF